MAQCDDYSPGRHHTPKQIQLDKQNGKLYWSDREGMRVMRSSLDGSNIETLVETGNGELDRHDQTNGVWVSRSTSKAERSTGLRKAPTTPVRAVSFERISKFQKARIRRIAGTSKLLFDGLPEPIDLDLDLANRMIYWTDRGDPPRGNTVNRAPMDAEPGQRQDPENLFTHLMEGIGLSLDLKGGRMFLTDLAGSVYSASLDGSNKKMLLCR